LERGLPPAALLRLAQVSPPAVLVSLAARWQAPRVVAVPS
jgi:hypothetical protein